MIIPDRWRWVLPVAVILGAVGVMLVVKAIVF